MPDVPTFDGTFPFFDTADSGPANPVGSGASARAAVGPASGTLGRGRRKS